MRAWEVLFVLVCGVALAQSLLAATVLLARRKGNAFLDRALAVLILTFSLRVSKAVAVFFFKEFHPVYEWGWFAAFLVMALVLPAYLSRSAGRSRPWSASAWVAAAAAAAAAGTQLRTYRTADARVFEIVFAAFVVSLVLSARILRAARRAAPPFAGPPARWASAVLAFMAAIGLLYATYYLPRGWPEIPVFYAEAVLFSAAVYALLLGELRFRWLARVHPSAAPEPTAAERELLARLAAVMERDKPYLDPALSLPALARSLRVTPQTLSRLVNSAFRSNFNDYVNRHRVEAAKAALAAPGGAARKIADVAFECGFNSVSVFYAAFRKFTGRTPARFLETPPAD